MNDKSELFQKAIDATIEAQKIMYGPSIKNLLDELNNE